jgi:hypothetical protein
MASVGWAIARLPGGDSLEITVLGALERVRVTEAVTVKVHEELLEVDSVTISHPAFTGKDPLSVTFAEGLTRRSRIELVSALVRAARNP